MVGGRVRSTEQNGLELSEAPHAADAPRDACRRAADLGSLGRSHLLVGRQVRSGRAVTSKSAKQTRRAFLAEAGLAAVSASSLLRSQDANAQTSVPHSAGTAAPTLEAPPNTCDCHHHIYDDGRFPPPAASANPMVSQARVEEYLLLKRRIRTTQSVIVTPAAYVTDNRVTLDAIARLGPNAGGSSVTLTGVAFLGPGTSAEPGLGP